MANDEAFGHEVDVMIRLNLPHTSLATARLFEAGSRSALFRFPEAGQYEDGDMFGAIVQAGGKQPDGFLWLHLLFCNDLARIYATAGTHFEIWHSRTIGDGVVLPGELHTSTS